MILEKVMVLRSPKRILNENTEEESKDVDLEFKRRFKVPFGNEIQHILRMMRQQLDGTEDLWRAEGIHSTGLFGHQREDTHFYGSLLVRNLGLCVLFLPYLLFP